MFPWRRIENIRTSEAENSLYTLILGPIIQVYCSNSFHSKMYLVIMFVVTCDGICDLCRHVRQLTILNYKYTLQIVITYSFIQLFRNVYYILHLIINIICFNSSLCYDTKHSQNMGITGIFFFNGRQNWYLEYHKCFQ